jgi:hypothetical protein
VYHSKVEGYKEAAACKGSGRVYHFGIHPDKEVSLKIAKEIQGGRGITLSCIHAVSFRVEKMETNLDMLHPDTNLFPFGTRMCIWCPHFPGAKSMCRTIEREIKEMMNEGNGCRSIQFAWEPEGTNTDGTSTEKRRCCPYTATMKEGCINSVMLLHSELPQLQLRSTTTMEHVHTSSHIAVTSGNSVLLWFSLCWHVCRASASLPLTRWTPLPSCYLFLTPVTALLRSVGGTCSAQALLGTLHGYKHAGGP